MRLTHGSASMRSTSSTIPAERSPSPVIQPSISTKSTLSRSAFQAPLPRKRRAGGRLPGGHVAGADGRALELDRLRDAVEPRPQTVVDGFDVGAERAIGRRSKHLLHAPIVVESARGTWRRWRAARLNVGFELGPGRRVEAIRRAPEEAADDHDADGAGDEVRAGDHGAPPIRPRGAHVIARRRALRRVTAGR